MKLLNTHQAAQVLNEPEGTLRYWRCAGKGPAYIKLAGRVRYDEADVIAYVNANKRIPSVRATLEGNRIGTLSIGVKTATSTDTISRLTPSAIVAVQRPARSRRPEPSSPR